MDIERLESPLMGWRIHTIEYPNRPSYVTLSDDDMEELMQVVSGKSPDDSGKEPDDLHLPSNIWEDERSDELKPCPFCGFVGNPHKTGCYFEIQNRPEYPSLYIIDGWEAWNTRPLEDALQAKLEVAKEALHKISIASQRPVITKIADEALKKLESE